MYGRLIVGTDLSPSAADALALARGLFPRAEMRVVNVVPAVAGLDVLGIDDLAPVEEAVQHNVAEMRRVLAETAGPGTQSAVLVGSVASEIARDAESFRADLVVVGARGRTRLESVLLGSVAHSVLRRVKCSVLIARSPGPVRTIAVGTDFNPPALKAAAAARALAGETGAELVAFHAADTAIWGEAGDVRAARGKDAVEGALKRSLDAFAADHLGGRARTVVAPGRPVETGSRLVRELKADLLAVGDHGPGAVERAILGSVAEGLAERAPCSVLVAR